MAAASRRGPGEVAKADGSSASGPPVASGSELWSFSWSRARPLPGRRRVGKIVQLHVGGSKLANLSPSRLGGGDSGDFGGQATTTGGNR